MVKLAADDQDGMIQAAPAIFSPAQGAWGRQGATRVRLAEAKRRLVEQGLESAWRARAPKTLVRKFDRERA